MRRIGWLAAGLAAAAIVALAWARGAGIGTSRHPFFLEARVARAAWRWLVPPAIRDTANPVPAAPAELTAGREHWADHCAGCHSNNGSGDTTVGRRVFPVTPDLREPRTQRLTDGELFYAIDQGIPWTAMPGWSTGTPEGERASWQLVRFIRHLPAITPDDLQDMERFNPKSPADAQRDRDIDDFLNGPAKPAPGGSGRTP
jgi:mono/diheme cytochrome c family protein